MASRRCRRGAATDPPASPEPRRRNREDGSGTAAAPVTMLSNAMLPAPPPATVPPDQTAEVRLLHPAGKTNGWKSATPPAPSFSPSNRKSAKIVPPPDRLPTTWMSGALGKPPPAAARSSKNSSAPSVDGREKARESEPAVLEKLGAVAGTEDVT